MERNRKLQATFGHALVKSVDILVAGTVGSLAIIAAERGIVHGLGQLP